jgi:hypothetical protein
VQKLIGMTMKLLSETPVLDKGYVAQYGCAPTGKEVIDLSREFFRSKFDSRILSHTNILLKIKCPLFVQLTFAEHGLFNFAQRSSNAPEAYIPNVADVNAMNLEASEAIQADIEQTTAALLLNPKAYQTEQCDMFVSQVISPVSVYNVLIVSGNLNQWKSYISQQGLPTPIEAFRKAIESVVSAEYPFLKDTK